MRPINLLRMPSLMRYVYSSVDTDIPVGRAVSLALAARRVSTNSLHTHVLPGVGQTLRGVSYWVPDLAETRKMVGSMTSAGEMRHVTVAVLNGSGVAGAAGQTAKRLRDLGHEVVSVGNADRFDYEQTQVVAVSGDLDAADMIAKVLGTKAAKKPQGTVADNAEVTVIVGRDLSSALVKGDYQTRR